jgi:amino acid permease
MTELGIITRGESRNFRIARFAWPLLFVLAALAIAASASLLVLALLGAVYAVLTVYLLFWRCPRCSRLYGVKFGLISIAWPFFGACLHCGSKLEAGRHGKSVGA